MTEQNDNDLLDRVKVAHELYRPTFDTLEDYDKRGDLRIQLQLTKLPTSAMVLGSQLLQLFDQPGYIIERDNYGTVSVYLELTDEARDNIVDLRTREYDEMLVVFTKWHLAGEMLDRGTSPWYSLRSYVKALGLKATDVWWLEK